MLRRFTLNQRRGQLSTFKCAKMLVDSLTVVFERRLYLYAGTGGGRFINLECGCRLITEGSIFVKGINRLTFLCSL